MIKFFRKIRQKLLEQNRVSKYLIYAFGEIILVVIGILIALQINNWNEDRKSKVTEIEILRQLNEDLKFNLVELKDIHEGINWSNAYGKKILTHLKSESLVLDSLKFWVEFFNYHSIFNNANTTYKNLENNEKKIISNDSLRLKITLMYERDFANVKKREQAFIEDIKLNYNKELFKNFKVSDAMSSDLNHEYKINTPRNIEFLKNNEDYKNELVNVYNFRNRSLRWLQVTLTSLEALIKEIDNEIKGLEL